MKTPKKPLALKGFTLIEMVVVIVVIAILASITIVSYTSVRNKSKDSLRATDIAKIKDAIVSYNVKHGGVPRVATYTTASYSGWDTSVNPDWLKFLQEDLGEIPVDPENKLVNNNGPDLNNRVYYYHCYNSTQGAAINGKPTVKIGYNEHDSNRVQKTFNVYACT